MRRLLYLLALLLLPALSASAQDVQAHRLEERLRSMARAEAAEAEAWARTHGLPLRVTSGGNTLELVALRRGLPVYLTTHNAEAAATTHTNRLHPGGGLGLGLTGAGMRLGIWDEGSVDGNHRELEGRVTRHRDALYTSAHATHVAGTLIATGLLSEARGMAYEANLDSYDWTADFAELEAEAHDGLLVSNHSYGPVTGWTYADLEDEGAQWYWLGDTRVSSEEDYLFGRYDDDAVTFDEVTRKHPYVLPVISAGNDRNEQGPYSGTYRIHTGQEWVTRDVANGRPQPDGGADGFDTVSGAAVAKNVLTVGSIGADEHGDLRPSRFSSFGPLDDGRIKPDLVGYGENLLSTLPGRDSYQHLSGTSMSAPNVAGSLLLLQQHHHDLHDRPLRAASLRALALHTAHDLGALGPDYRTGWGLLDAAAAVEQIDRTREDPLAILEAALKQNESHTEFAHVDTQGPLRVTLAWNDLASSRRSPNAAGLDDRRPHLVHDLDLRLKHLSSGTVYLPYVLDPENPGAAALKGDNFVDTVEQVFVASAPPGLYAIEVSHKDSLLSARQPYALVVTGAREATRPLVVDSFELRAAEDHVVLTWTTQLENDAATFTLERAALPGTGATPDEELTFVTVDSLPSARASGGYAYTYDHEHVLAGRYRYRLRVEKDAYEEVVASQDVFVVPPRRQSVLSAYPQPARDRITLVIDVPEPEDVQVDVYDVAGRRVASHEAGHLAAGRHHFPLDASGWAPGVYVARIVSQERTSTHPFVVTR